MTRELYVASILNDVKSFDVEDVDLLVRMAVVVADEVDSSGNLDDLENQLRQTQTESRAETVIYCCQKLAKLYQSA